MRVRAPPPLSDLLALAVAQRAERCTVNAVRCGFESRRPTFHSTRGVSQARTKARDSLSRTRGFESRTPCQISRSGGRGARHWIVDPDYASSNLVRSAFTCAASSTGTSTRLLSGGLRVRVPRGASLSECSLGDTKALGLGPRRREFDSHHSDLTLHVDVAQPGREHRPATPGTRVQIPPFTSSYT